MGFRQRAQTPTQRLKFKSIRSDHFSAEVPRLRSGEALILLAILPEGQAELEKRIRVGLNEDGRKQSEKEIVAEVSTNFYASNLELGIIPPVFVHQLGRSRWIIDTELFQTITTDGHLKKPSVHQGRGQALIVLAMIRVLAFTLTLVF
jgi:hypothetical protein